MTDDQTCDQIAHYRAQLQAVELCRAVSDGDQDAAEQLYTAEADAGQAKQLASALAMFAVSLARTAAANDDTITEQAIWQGLADRAETALMATHEIAEFTTDKENTTDE